ncbi:uncharacterized protein E0L32_006569 [Thyridium curvatum]|uniref:protein-tyrosine-phosphatase n=1 Tax=Thyridium curvatum TaxID=1093900 RepID=A0A507B2I0_9PEZI|nr:uncharacterized protein E0L32_006569 [Thyridium curvatum]TPX12924.1 hypothetical protein E0L32_006569 [Thyridium curvatum]
MSLDRVPGREDLYIGGIFTLRRADTLQAHRITHILSVVGYSLEKWSDLRGKFVHLSIDIDDVEDADLLVHLPKCVRFIESGLYPDSGTRVGDAEVTDADPLPSLGKGDAAAKLEQLSLAATSGRESNSPGAVFVHCAMGKSRSVTAVIAYLLWKHPHRFGSPDRRNPDRRAAARQAVARALELVKEARELAEPNDGFMRQLEMWWLMGCPAGGDDAVERHPVYRKWLYQREVEESARIGRAPDWLRFEDEEEGGGGAADGGQEEDVEEGEESAVKSGRPNTELRCKKCRRVLATQPFIVTHEPLDATSKQKGPCQHVFIEPLSWMRPTLERGELEGRLVCPNAKCGSSIGRYAWQGFKCTCREWVCPAFSLQRSKVDEVTVPGTSTSGSGAAARNGRGGGRVGGDISVDARQRAAAMGIRMPPGFRKENL